MTPARPDRPQNVYATTIDIVLAAVAIGFGLCVITDPPGGLIDGRHVLVAAAMTVLIIRAARTTTTNRSTR